MISPTIDAPARSEIRFSASTFPFTVPKITTSLALMLAFTLLAGPMVSLRFQVELPFQLAIQLQFFVAGYFAHDFHGFTENGRRWIECEVALGPLGVLLLWFGMIRFSLFGLPH